MVLLASQPRTQMLAIFNLPRENSELRAATLAAAAPAGCETSYCNIATLGARLPDPLRQAKEERPTDPGTTMLQVT